MKLSEQGKYEVTLAAIGKTITLRQLSERERQDASLRLSLLITASGSFINNISFDKLQPLHKDLRAYVAGTVVGNKEARKEALVVVDSLLQRVDGIDDIFGLLNAILEAEGLIVDEPEEGLPTAAQVDKMDEEELDKLGENSPEIV